MLTWHVISLAIIAIELFFMLKFKAYQIGLILVIASGLFLAFLAMWVGGDEYFASAPVLPCFIGVIVLLIKEIRANRTFATRYNPYCANSGLPKTLRIFLLCLGGLCSLAMLIFTILSRR